MSKVAELVTGPYEVRETGAPSFIALDYCVLDTRKETDAEDASPVVCWVRGKDDAQHVADALNFHHNFVSDAAKVLAFTRPAHLLRPKPQA